MRSSRTLLLLTFLLAASCGAGCGGSSAPTRRAPATDPDAPLVVCLGYADVEGGAAELRPERPGRVIRVAVKEGEEVKEKQELLTLDDVEARQEVARATAGVKAAEAREKLAQQDAKQHPSRLQQLTSTLEAATSRVKSARITLTRQEDLFQRNLVSKGDVDVAREQVREFEASVEAARARLSEARAIDPQIKIDMARAELEAARARLTQAEHVLQACILRAPSAGTILTASVRPGEVIGHPGSAAPLLFSPARPMVVSAEVEQELVARVKPGMFVQVRDEMAGSGPWKGSVASIGRLYVRRKHRTDPTQFVDVPTVECLIRMESGHPAFRIGQKLRVSIYSKAPNTEDTPAQSGSPTS